MRCSGSRSPANALSTFLGTMSAAGLFLSLFLSLFFIYSFWPLSRPTFALLSALLLRCCGRLTPVARAWGPGSEPPLHGYATLDSVFNAARVCANLQLDNRVEHTRLCLDDNSAWMPFEPRAPMPPLHACSPYRHRFYAPPPLGRL